jgi:imidazolonepropionase-like amidohydrolase
MAAKNNLVVIQGGRLIDGKGGKPVENATVVIEGNRITGVAEGKVDYPREAHVVDAKGKTILPGLIDNHVHYRSHSAELFLAHGVTSVRDLGNPLEWILAQRDAVSIGKIAGPRIFCAGGGFYGRAGAEQHMVAADAGEARGMARTLIDLGVDYLKIHLGVPLDITRVVAEVAHGAGLKVTGHLDSSIIPYAEAGVDGVEHATGCAEATIRSEQGKRKLSTINLWLEKFLAPWTLAEREHFPEVIEFLAKKGTFIEPTMVLWGASLGRREKWERVDYELLKDPDLSYIPENERLIWLDHHYLAYGARVKEAPDQDVVIGNRYSIYGILPEEEMREGHRRLGDFLCQLVKAGGQVVTGTDAPAVMPGLSLHRELELLVGVGLSPMEALRAATKVGADYLGKGGELGTVEEGRLADMIVVNGDPLKDITHTRRIEVVIKDGKIIDRGYHRCFTNPIARPYNREFYGYPMPKLEEISPKVATQSDRQVTVVLRGRDFFPGSVVTFGGERISTRFVSQKEFTAVIPPHLLKVGTICVAVVNPKPYEFPDRGGTSNTLPFIVRFSKLAEAA